MVTRTRSREIVDAIKRDFHTYLRKGVRIDSIVGDAHPELDIEDIESLLRVHFVLTKASDTDQQVGVIDFVDRLSERIRRLKTTTTGRREEVRGAIRGTVDWHETAKRRSRTGQLNEPLFVCLQREEHYDIEENLVLKRLLAVILEILNADLEDILSDPEGYDWLGYWSANRKDPDRDELPHQQLERFYRENIYLQRISVEERDVTTRMIESVKQSRSELYREAAELLDRYRRLMRHQLTDQEAQAVMNNTMIAPDAEDTLFELYWIFRLLNTYDDVEFRIIRDRTKPIIASWRDNGFEYTLYHNATGDALTFREMIENDRVEEDGYIRRMQAVLQKWKDMNERLLGRGGSESLWGGRPDIVLEKTSVTETGDRTLEQVFVGEVKYTTDTDYAATGLRELLEYMAFVRRASDQQYVESAEAILDSRDVYGLLFVDQLESYTDDESRIDIVQFGESLPPLIGNQD